ncbi:TrbC/VirB2 family protein [Rosenbergiella nectarea]|uniref:TrbC/VirB2 family protein n=1 Tax=Rosenbergiella nectarea TaxID=988801 RepID=UPI001BD9BDF1|nr:TrbC/VirB2 family protein [Rosenbergiella nectarea]MBT0731476.1 TrbC/VirB2 family protein [Rosenbergiella nectarea subsp. apis]
MSTIQYVKKLSTYSLLCLWAVLPNMTFAAGIDTGEAAMTSIQSWLNTWIPVACAICIMVCAFAWMLHLISIAWASRVAIGLIFIGSASYLVSLMGVSG